MNFSAKYSPHRQTPEPLAVMLWRQLQLSTQDYQYLSYSATMVVAFTLQLQDLYWRDLYHNKTNYHLSI